MPHSKTIVQRSGRGAQQAAAKPLGHVESRYTVGLAPSLATQVHKYAETVDTSMSKAIIALVRLGLESQANRKREFFKKLKVNLAEDEPNQQERLVDEFCTLTLGR